MKVGTIALLAIGILLARPVMEAPAVSQFATRGDGPVFAGSLFPFLFITIACGALSGFHSLISSGTTPKLLEKESQMRLIGYGGMLTESFVAIMALITASILNQHLYFAINAPSRADGDHRADGRRLRQRTRAVRRADHAPPRSPTAADSRRREIDRVAHRRRADAGPRHVRGAAPGVRRREPQGVLVPLRDHVRGPVHPDHRRRRHPGGPLHVVRRAGQSRRPVQETARSELAGRRVGLQPGRRRGAGAPSC